MVNIKKGTTINRKFNTTTVNGVPITISGSPSVMIYKGNNTVGSSIGATLTVDFNSITGYHNVLIATSDAFYEVGYDYSVIMSAGNVDGFSVVGQQLFAFSIENAYSEAKTTSISDNAISANSISSQAVSKIQSGLATPTNIIGGTIDTVTNVVNAPVFGDFTPAMKSSINNEIVDALSVDTYAEPGQGAPGHTLSLAAKINYLFKAWRNKKTVASGFMNLFNQDDETIGQRATVSDDGTTSTQGKMGTGQV